jgi:hypothetical protein
MERRLALTRAALELRDDLESAITYPVRIYSLRRALI